MASPLALALGMQQPISPTKANPVAPTDVVGAYKMATDAANTQYLAKLQQQNSLWGGLAGLGSAGILVAPKAIPALSGLLGSGAGAAGTGASPALTSALGAPTADVSGSLGSLATVPASVASDLGIGAGTAAAGAGDLASALALPTADVAGSLGSLAAVPGSVAADLAATAAPAVADAGAAAGAFSLADLLPFLFAA